MFYNSLAPTVASLARAVPSLARTVLKPSDLPPRGTRRPANLYWRKVGWMVGQLFFFGPYLENYFILFHNCFRSFLMMFFHIIWNILKKKIGMFSFSKNFAKIKIPLFRENFCQNFSNFSKTTQYFFFIVFGPLSRGFKTCFGIF